MWELSLSVSAVIAASDEGPRALRHALADVDVGVFDSLEAALPAWRELLAVAPASAYQRPEFVQAWFAAYGDALRVKPLIVVVFDASARPQALLPLCRAIAGRVRVARFVGGKESNFNLGLFRPGREWRVRDIEAILAAAARVAVGRVDQFRLLNMPREWDGAPHPLAAAAQQDSPSFGHKTLLDGDFQTWFAAHFSGPSRKKLRKKAQRLTQFGAISHRIAQNPREVEAILDAFFAHKRSRARTSGRPDPYGDGIGAAFLRAASGLDGADIVSTLEIHALFAGDRIVGTFGGLRHRERLSGLFLSFDDATDVARTSPGELLVAELVRDGFDRGLRVLDLGVGEARYKSEFCETPEPLCDLVLGVSVRGRTSAFALRGALAVKRAIKQSPRLFAGLNRVRYGFRAARQYVRGE